MTYILIFKWRTLDTCVKIPNTDHEDLNPASCVMMMMMMMLLMMICKSQTFRTVRINTA
jgi:hypothetical protein